MVKMMTEKKTNSISTKTNLPPPDSAAKSLPPFDDSFMYVETNGNNSAHENLVTSERTDIIQVSNITLFLN